MPALGRGLTTFAEKTTTFAKKVYLFLKKA
jgi:hypothetical protein